MLHMMVGLPGSTKTTRAKALAEQPRPDGFPVTMAMLDDWRALYDPVPPEEAAL